MSFSVLARVAGVTATEVSISSGDDSHFSPMDAMPVSTSSQKLIRPHLGIDEENADVEVPSTSFPENPSTIRFPHETRRFLVSFVVISVLIINVAAVSVAVTGGGGSREDPSAAVVQEEQASAYTFTENPAAHTAQIPSTPHPTALPGPILVPTLAPTPGLIPVPTRSPTRVPTQAPSQTPMMDPKGGAPPNQPPACVVHG